MSEAENLTHQHCFTDAEVKLYIGNLDYINP